MKGEYNKWYKYPEHKPEDIFQSLIRINNETSEIIGILAVAQDYNLLCKRQLYHEMCKYKGWHFQSRIGRVKESGINAWMIPKYEEEAQ